MRGRSLSIAVIAQHLPEVVAGKPFAEYVESFLAWKQPQVSPDRAKSYRLAMDHICQVIGKTPVDKILGSDWQRMDEVCRRVEFSSSWTSLVRAVARIWIKWAIRQRLVAANLLFDFDFDWQEPKMKILRKYLHLSPEQEESLCGHSPPWLARFIRVAVALGFRLSTLFALRWEWIDANWMLEIPGKYLKNGKDLRYPISARLQEILGQRGSGPILDLGCKSNVKKAMKRAGRRAGFPPEIWRNLFAHQLRRTWCLRAHTAGITREQAQDLQQWSSRNTLLRCYWPPQSDTEKRGLVERMA